MSEAAPAVRVFISYSRKDSDFVARLTASLQSKGYDVFVDTEDISGGEEWQKRLDELILSTDAVAFVLSPDSVASKICDWEVQRTIELGKRLIPVLWRPLDQQSVPAQLTERNYIFFDNPARFEPSLTQLCNACDVDIAWVREHTRLIAMATRWQAANRGRDGLLRGADLKAAKAWVAARSPRAPEIPETFQNFIAASEREDRRARGNRFRATLALGVLAILLVGSVVAFATQNQWRPVVDAAIGRYSYYDVVMPQSVGDGVERNTRVFFNGIDVGAVQYLAIYPNEMNNNMAHVVMPIGVPIRTDSEVEVRPARDDPARLIIFIGSGSPAAPLLPGSDGRERAPRLVARHGNDAQAFMDRASLYAHEDVARAIADYGEAIRLNPELASAHHARASLHLRTGDAAAAVADDDRAIELAPDNGAFLRAGCYSHAVWGEQLDQGLAQCDAAIRAEPGETGPLNSRGLIHLRRGEFQAALTDFDAIVRADNTHAAALYGRGIARLRLGQSEAGRADIGAATARDQSVASHYAGYGLAP